MKGKLTIKSKLSCCLLVTFHLLFSAAFVAVSGDECKPEGCGCKCTNENGTYEMSLNGIGSASNPLHLDGHSQSFTYSVSTCQAFTTKNTSCIDVTMCQTSTDKTENFPVANTDIEKCSKTDDEKVEVTYAAVGPRQMIITVGCAKKTSTPSEVDDETRKGYYTFSINTPDGCLRKVTNQSPNSGSSGLSIVIVMVVYSLARQ